jgi:hypothetical protein
MPTQQQTDHEILVQTVKEFLSGKLELGMNLFPVGAAIGRLKIQGDFSPAIFQGLVEWLDEHPAHIQGMAMMVSESLRQKLVDALKQHVVKPADATVVEDDEVDA